MLGDRGSGPSDNPLTTSDDLGRVTQPPPLESDVNRSVTPKRRGWLVLVAVATTAILAAGHWGSPLTAHHCRHQHAHPGRYR
ncbi:hypothetical protein EV385_2638 [Krasilnikovia cinnamomea]|uniref:Uncharacterized protein n=1 Tax=Krasilnikovia cinnamomea TaxID=349313 RepID=A0A4V6MG44_9ACTN|nr:hypothetical protein [Krasilnikovia cinnamomea]RZU50846.1 hypothetical protein EV385_2638 [Krasilnikovia cinnamomea]